MVIMIDCKSPTIIEEAFMVVVVVVVVNCFEQCPRRR